MNATVYRPIQCPECSCVFGGPDVGDKLIDAALAFASETEFDPMIILK